jgi:hypothetical protein
MKTPERAAALLVQGTLERKAWAQLEHEPFASKVRGHLNAVDLELAKAGGHFVVRPRTPGGDEDFVPTFHLHKVEQAMVAILYLFLRYLPAQGGQGQALTQGADRQEPSVDLDDLVRPFTQQGLYAKGYLEKIVLGHLKRAGFCEQRNGRYYAGPYLAALDPIVADARAKEVLENFQLRRFLRDKAEQLRSGRRTPTDDGPKPDRDGFHEPPVRLERPEQHDGRARLPGQYDGHDDRHEQPGHPDGRGHIQHGHPGPEDEHASD